jgi:hypothetical protein
MVLPGKGYRLKTTYEIKISIGEMSNAYKKKEVLWPLE